MGSWENAIMFFLEAMNEIDAKISDTIWKFIFLFLIISYEWKSFFLLNIAMKTMVTGNSK